MHRPSQDTQEAFPSLSGIFARAAARYQRKLDFPGTAGPIRIRLRLGHDCRICKKD
jgi:hypothetical protein